LFKLKPPFASIAFFLFFGSTVARAVFGYAGQPVRALAYGLLAGFLALSFTPPLLAPRLRWYPDLYLGLQSILPVALILLDPHQDYISTLYICLTIQAMSFFSIRKGFLWVAAFCALMLAALALAYGPGEGLLYSPSTVAGCVLIALYIQAMRRAEEEKNRSAALYGELQGAYRQLQKYTRQAEELAAVEERTRLARELHDSVTQKLFSLTLTAEAARQIQGSEPVRVVPLLERIQRLAHDSLSEMRALIQKLRPIRAAEGGLVASLRRHLSERREEDGLQVELVVDGELDLPAGVEEALFRIVQEALNNTVKHSGADCAGVALRRQGPALLLSIEDRGRGFRPLAGDGHPAHYGLSSMRERARSVGGRLRIESEPGRGTRICVEIPNVARE
jgi:signal transduction histidine kinase